MSEIVLNVKRRESGRKDAKKIRNEGLIPGVYYMKETEPISLYTDPMSLRPIVYTSSTNIIELRVEGEEETHECVLKEVIFDPITDKITHFDLLGIKKGQKFTVEIPIVISGQAAGIQDGGILQQSLHRLKVSCFPRHLIDAFELNVENLKIGDAIYIKDLDLENFDVDTNLEAVIVHVATPRLVSDEEEGLVEGEELAEGEEAAEGEDTESGEE